MAEQLLNFFGRRGQLARAAFMKVVTANFTFALTKQCVGDRIQFTD
jgi:hypothetical protein